MQLMHLKNAFWGVAKFENNNSVDNAQNRCRPLTRGFSGSLNTNPRSANASDSHGAQGGTFTRLLLGYFANNRKSRSRLVTRGFLASLNTNPRSASASDPPGAQGGPFARLLLGYFANNRNPVSLDRFFQLFVEYSRKRRVNVS